MKAKIKQPYSKQSRIVLTISTAIYGLLLAYQLITEKAMPSLSTEWIFYLPVAMFAVSIAYFQFTNLSGFTVDEVGIAHKTLFGRTIRKIRWSNLKTAEIASNPNMPFSPVFILISEERQSPSELRDWLKATCGTDTQYIFAVPYSDELVEAINRFSPVNCGCIIEREGIPSALRNY